jgi:trehalose 6-phosphate synthase/phosphatase
LGADLVGFHTLAYKRHFSSSLLVILGLETDVDRVAYGGREVRLGAFPMGIDARRFDSIAAEPDVVKRVEEIRSDANGRNILLGVDRLDYTKGIRRRLLAVERLLRREPELANRIRMIQVTVPSRGQVEAYGEFRRSVDEIVGRINGDFATPDSVVIHYMYRGLDERELIAMYCAADALLVTPVRDGMNLVAKEFVASRRDENGVLLLSEFAGAASELGEALDLNPYDIDRTASTILRALSMPQRERRARMRALRARVFEHDIHHWAEDFIEALEMTHPGEPGRTVRPTAPEVVASLVQRVRGYQRVLLMLDYDGTLVSFADRPEQAAPDGEIREILQQLAARPDTRVHVLSGRMRADLERWLGDLSIGLHAEHGFWSRLDPQSDWEAVREVSSDWKRRIHAILEQFVERTPGSWIEEKTASIAWHYRLADPQFANNQARELRYHLHEVLSNLPVEVLKGEKVVEVRLYGIHKGIAVQRIVADLSEEGQFDDESSVIVAMGDDRTDEDMFAALPPGSFAVQVGPKPSRARYRLQDVAAARDFLRCILKH